MAKKLSEAEQKRLERFERISEDMRRQGCARRDLTIDIGKANVFSVILLIALFIIGCGLYYLVHRRLDFSNFNLYIFIVVLTVLIVVHELIHGLCWSFFTPNHFKDIEFGILRSSFTPYCACLVPLKKGPYIFGTAMPLIVLGILPMLFGIIAGHPGALFMGCIMAASAAGDILIIHRLLTFKSGAKEIVYMDHPTEAGGVVFER